MTGMLTRPVAACLNRTSIGQVPVLLDMLVCFKDGKPTLVDSHRTSCPTEPGFLLDTLGTMIPGSHHTRST